MNNNNYGFFLLDDFFEEEVLSASYRMKCLEPDGHRRPERGALVLGPPSSGIYTASSSCDDSSFFHTYNDLELPVTMISRVG